MENSGKLLFGDDAPQWYVALGTRWVGPMTASDIYEKITRHQLSWAHYVWRKGQTEWKRICDVKTFQAAVPHQPAKAVQKEIKDAAKPTAAQKSGPPPAPQKDSAEPRIWYLYYNDSQFGPFSQDEILRFIKIGKIHGRVHAWREGMKNWERIDRLDAFQMGEQKSSKKSEPIIRKAEPKLRQEEKASDQRASPRRPLVAKILMADEQSVIVGVCRDISIGGLQVLTEQIPAKVGSKLKMNISPSSNDSGSRIEPFVAEGVIVRILEDGRGFSFRFERLSDRAKQAIESYIESPL